MGDYIDKDYGDDVQYLYAWELEEIFDEYLADTYGEDIAVGPLLYPISELLRDYDPISYNRLRDEWINDCNIVILEE